MAGQHNLTIMRIHQNMFENFVKTCEVGTLFALEERPGFSVWGNIGFLFIMGLCL